MEKKLNYSVTSDPKVNNSDGDKLTDFEEFMNGSDPRSLDTDGDGIDDTNETLLKSNITGIEGTPPEIKDVKLTVEVHKHEEQTRTPIGCLPPLWVPDGLRLHVIFTVTDAVGVKKVEVRVTKALGAVETHAIDAGAADKGSVGSDLG